MMSNGQPMTEQNLPPSDGKRKNWNWIWPLIVMFSLGALAFGINLTYNLRQQLTFEQFRKAKETWERFGANDYDLVVHKDVTVAGNENSIHDVIQVQVRKRMVTDMQFNGKPADRRLWGQNDMTAWMDWIDRFLEMDHQPSAPRTFCIATFDPEDGHLIKYIRSVRGTGDRQELNIELNRLP